MPRAARRQVHRQPQLHLTVPISVGGEEGEAKRGSPNYTDARTSSTLPPVPPSFGGGIKPIEADPRPRWHRPVVPLRGALVFAGAVTSMAGILLWPAVHYHAVLAAWSIACACGEQAIHRG